MLAKRYSLNDVFALFSFALLILWRAINAWLLPMDGAGRIPFIFLIFSFILFAGKLDRKSLRPVVLYFVLAIYMTVNGFLKGSQYNYESSQSFMLIYNIFTAPVLMFLLAIQFRKNFDGTLRFLIGVLFVYVVLFLLNGTIDDENRLGGEINANEAALCMAICIDLLLLAYIRKVLPLGIAIILALVPFYGILATASRMAMTMSFIVVLPAFFLSSNKRNARQTFFMVIAMLAVVFLAYYVMNFTLLGQRMAETTTQSEDKVYETGTVLDVFGDRGGQYYFSWPYFLQNPITGIGLGNWRRVYFAELVAHSEYMVMYVENGLIAFILYIVFLVSLFKRVSGKARSGLMGIDKRSSFILMFMLISILFENLVLWAYNEYALFVVYSMVLAIGDKGMARRFVVVKGKEGLFEGSSLIKVK